MKVSELIYKIAVTAMCVAAAIITDGTLIKISFSIMAVIAGVVVIDDIVMMIWEKRK